MLSLLLELSPIWSTSETQQPLGIGILSTEAISAGLQFHCFKEDETTVGITGPGNYTVFVWDVDTH